MTTATGALPSLTVAMGNRSPTLVIRAPRVFDGWAVRPDAEITVSGDTIVAVRSGGQGEPWTDAQPTPDCHCTTLAFADATVLPGLIDAHVHLSLLARAELKARPAPESGPDALADAAVDVADAYLARGVTTLRDLGDRQRLNLKVRQLLRARARPGPRVIASGQALHRRGSYGGFMGVGVGDQRQLLAAAEQELLAGADFLKVIASGIIDFQRGEVPAPLPFTPHELRALVDFAHGHGIPVAAHASGAAGVDAAVWSGADFIEHGFFGQDGARAAYARRACTWVPTFIPVEVVAAGKVFGELTQVERGRVGDILVGHAAMLRDVYTAGGTIAVGSDAGSPGVWEAGGILGELRCCHHAGLPPPAVLELATRCTAEALRLDREVGTIEPGKRADLVVVAGNPLQTLEALQDVRLVVRDGIIVWQADGQPGQPAHRGREKEPDTNADER